MKKSILKELAKYEKQSIKDKIRKEQLQALCDHKIEKKGKEVSALRPHGDNFKCKLCGSIVDFNPVDKVEVEKSVNTIRRVLEQVKTIEDMDSEVLERIATFSQLLNRVEDLYKDTRKEMIHKANPQQRYQNESPSFHNNIGNYYIGDGPLFVGDYKGDKKHKNKKHHDDDKKKKNKNKGGKDVWYNNY